jgi:hypothetical protein
VAANGSEGLLVRAEPLGAAENISRRMVDVQVVDGGALLLAADPTWAGAINTVLIKKGVRVNELRPVSDIPLPEEDKYPRSARPRSDMPVMQVHRLPACAIIYLWERGRICLLRSGKPGAN